MEEFFKEVHGLKGARLREAMEGLGHRNKGELVQGEVKLGDQAEVAGISLEADLRGTFAPGDGRCWGKHARNWRTLYPTYADWQPVQQASFEPQPMRLIDPDENGVAVPID